MTPEEQAKADAEAKAKADAESEQEKKYSKAELDKVIDERDKAKEKLRKIDEEKKQAEQAKAIEEGKLKEVLSQKETEIGELKKIAETYEAQQIKLRESYLSKLSDEDKQLAVDIKDIDKLQTFVERLTKQPEHIPYNAKNKQKSADDTQTFKSQSEFEAYYRKKGMLE